MSDQNSQGGNGKNKKNGQGGFIAVLHNLEEKFYGPDSPLPAVAKIALYLRHRALRDWTKRKQIPKSEIMTATGVDRRAAERALKSLEKDKLIQVTRTKIGKVWSDNTYELHPSRFGDDYVFRPEKPSFRVIYGSKGHKSNPGESYPQNSEVPSNEPVGVPSNEPVGVPTYTPAGKGVKNAESLRKSDSKNPLKEPIKRTLSENEINLREKEREEAEKAKDLLSNLVGGIFGRIPR